jgi:hypothetical protein
MEECWEGEWKGVGRVNGGVLGGGEEGCWEGEWKVLGG